MTSPTDDETLQGMEGFRGSTDSAAEARYRGADTVTVFAPPPRPGLAVAHTTDETLAGLEFSLRSVLAEASHPREAFEEVRQAWLPWLGRALELAGGDGADAWLSALLGPPRPGAADPLFGELVAGVAALRACRDLVGFEQQAFALLAVVQTALRAPGPAPLSTQVLGRELEASLGPDELLRVACATHEELARRLRDLGAGLGELKDQLGSTEVELSFARLKAELRLVDAELSRRTRTGQG